MSVTLIGGPTAILEYGGRRFITDPTFDPPGTYPGGITLRKLDGPAIPAHQIPVIDVVLLSHDQHADNLDRSGRSFLAEVPTILTTPQASDRIPSATGVAPWQRYPSIPGERAIRVTAVAAEHGAARVGIDHGAGHGVRARS